MSLSQMVMQKLVANKTTTMTIAVMAVTKRRNGDTVETMLTLSMSSLTNSKRTVARSREQENLNNKCVEESIELHRDVLATVT